MLVLRNILKGHMVEEMSFSKYYLTIVASILHETKLLMDEFSSRLLSNKLSLYRI